ncbi:hypothetical protein Misp01_32910 [Microtetraspora sp. NBRC 13810]|uniref:DUF2786 domain-containing protein n=1 Tax=Microtetraspora sp. NBRC 13810 TaxID=3030990 RepID=UPI0024A124E2|nr:DUF2786 domain-containing protein [Microtetraspora sp. NBRC 13810]GLW08161.1 hypothetical protein Misp01_32910 [Microtetraspora sp. NBRC 13810]
MTTSDDHGGRVLGRVRKLLAKAEGTDNEHERDTFLAAATSLMARYGIEQAMLGDAQPGAGPGTRLVYVPGPWADEKAGLVYLTAEALRCKCVLVGKKNNERGVHLFGFAADLERAELLYTSLLLQMATGLARAVVPPGTTSPRAWRRSWLLGFVSAAAERVQTAERHAEAEAKVTPSGERGTELVLARREGLVTEAFRREYPKVRMSRPRSSGTGYQDGAAAGRRADLGGTGLGPGPHRPLGR